MWRRPIRPHPRAMPAIVLGIACLGWVGVTARVVSGRPQDAPQTTRDKVFTKTQAASAADQFGNTCAGCHDPAKVPAGKKPAPQIVGAAFVDKWSGRTLDELVTLIETTMPSDGSVVLTTADALNLTAYILQANGFPDGAAALTATSAKAITIKK